MTPSLTFEPVTSLYMAAPEHLLDQSVKACILCKTFKSHSAFYKNKTAFDGHHTYCISCDKLRAAQYRNANREKERARTKRYHSEDRQREVEKTKRWRKLNPHKERAQCALREASKINACPPWCKTKEYRKEFAAIYQHAKWLQKITGEKHEVDHTIPLRNDFVCGLHVPWNLMVLPKKDNNSKSAYWWPGQLDCQTGRGKSHQWWRDLQNDVENGSQ